MASLPEVSQRFEADTRDYVAGLQLAIEAAERLRDMNLETVASVELLTGSMTENAAAAAATAGRVNDLRDSALEAAVASGDLSGAVNDLRDSTAAASAASGGLSRSLTGMAGRVTGIVLPALGLLDAELDRKVAALTATAGSAGLLSGAMTANAASTANAGAAAARTTRLFWLTGNAIHWIIAGSAELLAVLVPATVAAASWAFVWLQGATSVYQHMTALFGATEALGQSAGHTFGEMLGLSGAFQRAQNAANPDVYQALGAALAVVKETSGGLAQTGLQAGRIFDTFLARLVYDFSAAGHAGQTLSTILRNMIPDLVKIGQVGGNLGHFIASTAAQMPGLAEVLLSVLDGVTRLAAGVTDFTSKIHIGSWTLLTFVMGIEEFNRWGSLMVSMLGRMGLATAQLSGGMGSYFLVGDRFIGILKNIYGIIPNLAFGIATLASRIPVFGAAVVGATEDIQAARAATIGWIAELTTLETLGIAIVAAGLGFLIYKLVTAKTAAQQFAASLQADVAKASNVQVINVLAQSMSKLGQAAADAAHMTQQQAVATGSGLGAAARYADAQQRGALVSAQYTAAQQQMGQQLAIVISHVGQLAATYGTTFLGAIELADQAGVKLNQTLTKQGWAIAQIQIASLVRGYQDMGQSAGVVGRDMTALAIQSGLAGSKMTQLNQAWDQFMSNVTGGTGGLAGFETALKGMTGASATFAASLTSFTGKGAADWTAFDQVVGSTAPQMIDWLRTAGAEGALSGTQFSQAVRDMVAQMLPLASRSRAAASELGDLAQQAGGPATTSIRKLAEWADNGKTSVSGLAKIVDDATGKMGDMSGVAQQLGTVMQSDIITTMDQARIAATGMTKALQEYYTELIAGTEYTERGQQTYRQLIRDFELIGDSASQARQMIRLMQAQIDAAHGKTINLQVAWTQTGAGTGLPGLPSVPGHHITGGGSASGGPDITGNRAAPDWQTAPLLRSGAADGGDIHVHVHVQGDVDGQSLWRMMQVQTAGYTTLNSGGRTGKWVP